MKIIMKTFYKSKTPEDSLLVLTRQNYSATHIQKLVLSRPLRSNLTTPSILANNVSSPPRPTFSPG